MFSEKTKESFVVAEGTVATMTCAAITRPA